MELKIFTEIIRKWWWFLIAATLVAASSAYFAVRRQPDTYQTRTTLTVGQAFENPNPTGIEISLSQQLAAIYSEIANRQTVREQTMAALGTNWLPSYVARPIPNSQFIEIVVTHTNPQVAQVTANELAKQLIQQSPTASKPEEQERQAFIDEQLTSLEAKITETEDEIATKEEQLETALSATQISDLEDEIRSLENDLDSFQANYAALLANTQGGAINTISVIEQAHLPSRPVGPNRLMTILTVSAIGFVLAFAAAFVIEYFDDTIHNVEDLMETTNLPILPAIGRFKSEGESALITYTEPRSPVAETFRALRTVLMSTENLRKENRTLLVTSVKPGDGKSVIAANLGIVMAQAGSSVLVIDGDLRKPSQHELFGLSTNNSLTSFFLDSDLDNEAVVNLALMKRVIRKTRIDGLHLLLPNSSKSTYHPEMYSSKKIRIVIELLKNQYDIVIIDSPPVLAVHDAVDLGTQVDGILLIASKSHVRRKELRRTIKRLQDVEANILGVSLNRISPKREGYYYTYYEDYYISEDSRGKKSGSPPKLTDNDQQQPGTTVATSRSGARTN